MVLVVPVVVKTRNYNQDDFDNNDNKKKSCPPLSPLSSKNHTIEDFTMGNITACHYNGTPANREIRRKVRYIYAIFFFCSIPANWFLQDIFTVFFVQPRLNGKRC